VTVVSYDPGMRTVPTLEDVAKVAGVSRATVSRVIHNQRRVAPELKEVVERAIAATGYVPNRAARSLVTGRTGSVLVAVTGTAPDAHGGLHDADVFADPFFSRVVGGFVRSLRTRDVHPTLMLVESDADRARLIASLRQGMADGVLLVSTLAGDPLPRMLVDATVPAVAFARPAEALPISFVDVANQDGARLAADHLAARGCRETGVISGPLAVPAALDRLSGFRTAMARHGNAYVPAVEGNFTVSSGRAAMVQLLDATPEVDGVFASNDLMALGAIDELQHRGRRVPDDVAVVGFDDHTLAALSRPPLTTVRQPIEEMAGRMAQMLLDEIDAPERQVSSAIFEPILVVRASA
jgi:DNA-binding LacI/PurR family transcriptional regulator